MGNSRKKQFVDKQVQGRLIVGIAFHWLLYFMLVACAIPLWDMVMVSGLSKPFPTVLIESWSRMTPVFLFLAAVLPIFVWETIKLSNRFVGPMYRLRKTIRSLNAGEKFEPLRFRKDDFWQDVADDFNEMMERLSPKQATEPSRDEEELAAVG